ncbi:MAG: hypothetical protein ACYDAD_04705 [Acidimicrobiales bacterium]
MVLVSFLLVLAAAVTLVIGLLNVGLGLIYVSIACSVLAGIVLAVAVVRNRPGPEVATADGPEEMAPPLREPSGIGAVSLRDEPRGREDATAAMPMRAVGAFGAAGDDADDELEFPIADYDELRVSEILPLLGELDPDELEMVRDREEAGSARSTVLKSIDRMLEEDGGALGPPPPAKAGPAKKASATKRRAPAKKTAAKRSPTIVPAKRVSTRAAATPKKAGTAKKAAPAKKAGKAKKATKAARKA